MEKPAEGFPVTIEVQVAWGEMDAFQHVNNIVYFRYFESVRIAYFEKLNMLDFMTKTGIGPILASTACRFKIPLSYPDTVLVSAKVTDIKEDRFTMRYLVYSKRHGRTAAEGDGLIVAFDYRNNRKTAVPEELKQRIREIEGMPA